jgi:hypothetical protein
VACAKREAAAKDNRVEKKNLPGIVYSILKFKYLSGDPV